MNRKSMWNKVVAVALEWLPRDTMPLTLFDRIWDDHTIAHLDERTDLLQVDRHLVHEVSSPEAFRQLRRAGRGVASPAQTFATQDHIVSTRPGRDETSFAEGTEFVRFLRRNCDESGIRLFALGDPRQGIVHVIAGELGLALPGSTVVCGDSHTATLGAFGALAWGVGTSEVAHVLATQTLAQVKPKPIAIRAHGRLAPNVAAKDLILAILGRFGIDAGVGRAVEYTGDAIRALDMEARMTVCNMSIELGARFGLIAPDDTTFAYLAGRPHAPRGADWDAALAQWRTLRSDDGAPFERTLDLDASALQPQITWGTTPGDVVPVDGVVPASGRPGHVDALRYMGLEPGQRLVGTPVDYVFIGSCTNSRLSDLRAAAAFVRGRRVAPHVRALVVPGSSAVRAAAEHEGLHRDFTEAGFEWREAGCSMCLGINDDVVPPGKRCVSTSNRNFEGRQGPGARTHLASPLTAAASAIAGRIADPSKPWSR
jgi:3-isopropylmalate/(R)-2-methylmalate dehydratase large subunit